MGQKRKGYAGFYSLLNSFNAEFNQFGDILDLSDFETLTFDVRGEVGGEDFEVGLADVEHQIKNNSIAAGYVSEFLEQGVTTKWQQVTVPLVKFININLTEMGAFSILFKGKTKGTIYLDNIRFNQ